MAWNPSPEVAVARDAAKKLDASECIILWIDHDKELVGMASYGKTKALCAEARQHGDYLYDKFMERLTEGAE